MTTVPQLGPRAALLLGFLSSGPKTEAELHRMAAQAGDVMIIPTTRGAALELAAGGEREIRKQLERLATFDWTRAVADPEGGTLWAATAPCPPASHA